MGAENQRSSWLPGWRKRDEASTFTRLRSSRHVAELRLIFYVAVTAALVASSLAILIELEVIKGGSPNVYTWADTVKFVGAILLAGSTIMAWAYQTGSRRLGVVDLFACEIATLCRVGTVVKFVPTMIDQYDAVGLTQKKAVHPENSAQALRFSSEENYFPVFESNSKDLQILEAKVVNNVTAFYTYMKATRDMLRQLAELRLNEGPPNAERTSLVNVIYMVFLSYESARRAIDKLVEFEPSHAENTIVMLFTELPAYLFLRKRYADEEFKDQIRMKRLDLRLPNYHKFIPALCNKVRGHADDEDWEKANSLVEGLEKEFELLKQETAEPTSAPAVEKREPQTVREIPGREYALQPD